MMGATGAGRVLFERGVLSVPDIVASAGAVVDGVGQFVMGLGDRGPLLERLGQTTYQILEESQARGARPEEIAEERAWSRIRTAAGNRA